MINQGLACTLALMLLNSSQCQCCWRQKSRPCSNLTAPLHATRACVSETKRTGNLPCSLTADVCFSNSLSIAPEVKEIHRYVKCIHRISRLAPTSIIVRIYPVGYKALLEHLTSIPSVCLRGGFRVFLPFNPC